MKGRLVDTNIVSYALKSDTRGDMYRKHLFQSATPGSRPSRFDLICLS
jgi:hypothetical protein